MKNHVGPSRNTEGLRLCIVGHVSNDIERPMLEVNGDQLVLGPTLHEAAAEIGKTEQVGRIVIDPALDDILLGIEGYSHLVLLYWAHEVPESGRCLTRVHPMGRAEIPLQGVFSTCSPARPNPVLMCVVRLLRRQGNVLEVTGCDAVDGSPVLDIKPYVEEFYPRRHVVVPRWMRLLLEEMKKLAANRRGKTSPQDEPEVAMRSEPWP